MIIRDHETGALYEVSVHDAKQRTLLLRELTAAEVAAFSPSAWQNEAHYDIALEA